MTADPTMQSPKIIFGVFQLDKKDDAKLLLDICEEAGIKEVDSGVAYVGSV